MTMTFPANSTYERVRLADAQIRLIEGSAALRVSLLLWSNDDSSRWFSWNLEGDALAAFLRSVMQVADVTEWDDVVNKVIVAVRPADSHRLIGLSPAVVGQVMPNTAFAFASPYDPESWK